MNKTTLAIVFVALMFGIITVHLARSLAHERELASNLDPSVMATPGTQAQPSVPEDGISPEVSATGPPTSPEDDQILAARERLERFNDPKLRAAIVARARESLAQTWKPISASLRMPESTLENLLDVLSEQSASHDQRRLECQIDRLCNPEALNASLKESGRYNLESYLGPERLDKYNAYIESIPERTYIQDLQARMPDGGHVDDDTVERLALALSTERRRFVTSTEQSGKKIQVIGFVVKEYEGDKAPKSIGGPFNEVLTDQFRSKLSDVASGILSSEQLAEFKKLQEERANEAKLMSGLHSK